MFFAFQAAKMQIIPRGPVGHISGRYFLGKTILVVNKKRTCLCQSTEEVSHSVWPILRHLAILVGATASGGARPSNLRPSFGRHPQRVPKPCRWEAQGLRSIGWAPTGHPGSLLGANPPNKYVLCVDELLHQWLIPFRGFHEHPKSHISCPCA